ncbi:hypothetical protein BEN78_03320 [Xanthomonas citri pv. mangiferaeindicae]|nr:hypothetical protein BEN78_03320 [Xanthomonas citri pv. mangiferaeindicae]
MTSRLLRFLISGGSAAAVEYSVFFASHLFLGREWLLLSQSVSFACGFILSFLLNRHWVFRSSGIWGVELLRYGVLAVLNLMIGIVAISALVGPAGMLPLIAKFVVMAMIAAWNYLIFSKLVFRPEMEG